MHLTDEQIDRYSRQIILPEVGGVGQSKLLAASVGLAGAGPLVEWAALYLAAAGVGRLCLSPAGAKADLLALNPDCRVDAGDEQDRLDAVLADALDAAALARAALAWAAGVPVVLASALGPSGAIAVARVSDPASACPRCCAPAATSRRDHGPAAAPFVATVATTEVLKLLLGVGAPLCARRLSYDAHAQTVVEEPLPRCSHRATGAP